MAEVVLKLENISKRFGATVALDGVSLSVEKGEFVSLLGPSGCGKTTLLRIIAGLENADSGKVFLRGEEITALPPEKRAVNTVFQSYALFPHMTVEKNIAYGLKVNGEDKKTIKEKTASMLSLVRLEGEEKKYPHQLSGGQKQRVAIARGLINSPEILLLDEPMGALDLQLRKYLGDEMRRIQKETKTAFVYITHDRDEAMNMSDRMIVMNKGRFIQSGSPEEIYNQPSGRFVADFIGLSNIIKVQGGKSGEIILAGQPIPADILADEGKEAVISIRSENVSVYSSFVENSVKATLIKKSYSGGFVSLTLDIGDGNVITGISADKQPCCVGDEVYFRINPSGVALLEG